MTRENQKSKDASANRVQSRLSFSILGGHLGQRGEGTVVSCKGACRLKYFLCMISSEDSSMTPLCETIRD